MLNDPGTRLAMQRLHQGEEATNSSRGDQGTRPLPLRGSSENPRENQEFRENQEDGENRREEGVEAGEDIRGGLSMEMQEEHQGRAATAIQERWRVYRRRKKEKEEQRRRDEDVSE